MTAQNFWLWGTAGHVLERTIELADQQPPKLVVKFDQNKRHARTMQDVQNSMISDKPYVPKPIDVSEWENPSLTITEETFYPDFLHDTGYMFVSERLRNIMDLSENVAQYLPVNTEQSHTKAQQQNYQALDVYAVRDVIDIEKSVGEYHDVPQEDGTTKKRILGVKEVVWKEGFISDVPIFRDPHDARFFVTDAFAEKILTAGITDLAFQDITSERAKKELVLKEL